MSRFISLSSTSRIFGMSSPLFPSLGGALRVRSPLPWSRPGRCRAVAPVGENAGEGRAAAGRALHCPVPAHHGAEVLGDGEPQARAAEALGARVIGLAERLEQLIELARGPGGPGA